MKKLILAFLFTITIMAAKAQPYGLQTVTINNNTSCWVNILMYAQGTGSCTQYTIGPDWPGTYSTACAAWVACCPSSVGIPSGGSISFDNGNPLTEIVGLFSPPYPGSFNYRFTGLRVVSSWSGTCTCTPKGGTCGQFCNSYSVLDVGEACTGYSTSATVTTVPPCCGQHVDWISNGIGTNTIVNLY